MRRTNYGLWTNDPEPNENELDVVELYDSEIPLSNEFFCDMFLKLFEKYPVPIVDIVNFMKHIKKGERRWTAR